MTTEQTQHPDHAMQLTLSSAADTLKFLAQLAEAQQQQADKQHIVKVHCLIISLQRGEKLYIYIYINSKILNNTRV